MSADCVIVDANIAFKCLHAGRGDLRERLGPGGHPKFFSPRYLFVELFKHKERLMRAAGLPEAELLDALYSQTSHLEFVNEANIPVGTWVEAYRLCKGIDENDTPYVALTLHMDGRFWTENRELKIALRARLQPVLRAVTIPFPPGKWIRPCGVEMGTQATVIGWYETGIPGVRRKPGVSKT